ncbi:DUF350 domain-containing protein [Kocuria sp.]|uniref:DUF350 domain-containing protein n=1 Tax=Kocuria sp. TaxID=1871328 RepID=UPI0026E0F5B4|nr:DUF350 domain-containing protein [Kocuria sp.]MDO5617822.1 DUF350 domain-containing protein [Kocuria sp.]
MDSVVLSTMLYSAAAAASYGLVGLLLLALGYWLIDLLTPGKLHQLIWADRNRGAVLVLGASILAMALIIRAAILGSASVLWLGLITTLIYGLIGLLLMAVSFFLMDLLAPGKLGELIVDGEQKMHPAVWITATTHLAVGLVVAAAIT